MTLPFPLSLPAGKIASARARLVNNVAKTRSVFTGEAQSQRYQGERFEFDLTVRPLSYRNGAIWKATFAALYGGHGTLLYGDPDYLAQGPGGALGGTPLVDGAGQLIAAETLNTKGWTPNRLRVLAAGDMLQLGTGGSARLHMALEDVNSDAGGLAVVPIWPRLRTSPANSAAIIVTGAMGVFELADAVTEYSTDQRSVYAFAFRIREAL